MSFCRTLVDEWVRAGVTDAVVAPGSRSTPLALAVFERLRCTVMLDERSAAFCALGMGLATGRPSVLVCTSGTAATHFYGAVVEASLSCVPLIVCTADRPPELQSVGAPQTIDQTHLYGDAVRWFAEPGPSDTLDPAMWRSLAARAFLETSGRHPGPVHLNLAFREPLIESDQPLPSGRSNDLPWHGCAPISHPVAPPSEIAAMCHNAQRPLIVAGHDGSNDLDLDGVPIIGDHRGTLPHNVAHADLLIRSDHFCKGHKPDLIIRSGMPPASKALHTWLDSLAVPQLVIQPNGAWIDPSRQAVWYSSGRTALTLRGESGWLDSWTSKAAVASSTIAAVLAAKRALVEPVIARAVLATCSPRSKLVVSSSMPIRDIEAFAEPRVDVQVYANRGANGIDGLISTARGIAQSGAPTTLLLGDLAFLHDSNGLLGLAESNLDLTIVIVDNNGGGIFSLLPQRDVLDTATFEALFGTPQSVSLETLLRAHEIQAVRVDTPPALAEELKAASDIHGPRAVIATTCRDDNVVVHNELIAAVAEALDAN